MSIEFCTAGGAAMVSSETRQLVMVFGAFAAGAALAWVPFSAKPLPFRATAMYPVWEFLIAAVCASCPLVWSHGRRALAQFPARRPITREALGYAVSAAALAVTTGGAVRDG